MLSGQQSVLNNRFCLFSDLKVLAREPAGLCLLAQISSLLYQFVPNHSWLCYQHISQLPPTSVFQALLKISLPREG